MTFRIGPSLSTILLGQYDIVGWDPRGIGKTTPGMRCFESLQEETIFLAAVAADGDLQIGGNETQYREAVARGDGWNKIVAGKCEAMNGEGAGRHVRIHLRSIRFAHLHTMFPQLSLGRCMTWFR